MATADQIKALVDSHGAGDDARFRAVAMQVAARAAKKGHTRLADEIRALLDATGRDQPRQIHSGSVRPVPMARPAPELTGLLDASYTRLADEIRALLDATGRDQPRQIHSGSLIATFTGSTNSFSP